VCLDPLAWLAARLVPNPGMLGHAARSGARGSDLTGPISCAAQAKVPDWPQPRLAGDCGV